MIAEIGHFALMLALAVALIQMSVPMIGAQTGRAGWMATGTPAAQLQFVLVAISFAALTRAFSAGISSPSMATNVRGLGVDKRSSSTASVDPGRRLVT